MQVREQERLFARRVRESVRRGREEERRVLDEHLKVGDGWSTLDAFCVLWGWVYMCVYLLLSSLTPPLLPQSAIDASHSAELRSLENQYLSRVGQLGQAHRDAQRIGEVRREAQSRFSLLVCALTTGVFPSQEAGQLEELRLLLAARQR